MFILLFVVFISTFSQFPENYVLNDPDLLKETISRKKTNYFNVGIVNFVFDEGENSYL